MVSSDAPSVQVTDKVMAGFSNIIPRPIPFGAIENSASAPGARTPRFPEAVFGLMMNPPVISIAYSTSVASAVPTFLTVAVTPCPSRTWVIESAGSAAPGVYL